MWPRIKSFFLESETIFLARLQMFAGTVVGVFVTLDRGIFQAYVPAQYVPVYLLAVGVLTEYVRRRRDPNLGRGQ